MRRLFWLIGALLLVSVPAWALFMSSGGTPPSAPPTPTITSVTPSSVSIPDTTTQGTTIIQYVCHLSDGTTPPCTYTLSAGSALPGFLTLSAGGTLVNTNTTPPLPDCTPSQDNCTWSVDAVVGAPSQSISQVTASCAPSCGFNVGTVSNTAIGSLAVVMNPAAPAFGGVLSLVSSSATCTHTENTTDFQITGSAPSFTLATKGTSQTAQTYYVCVQATQAGLTAVTQEFAIVGTSISQTIGTTAISCGSNCRFVAGAGSVIGTLSTTMTPSSPGFAGTYTLVNTVGTPPSSGCTDAGDITHFSLATGYPTPVNTSGPGAGTYNICVRADQATGSNTPQYQEFTIIGNVAGASNCPTTAPPEAQRAGYTTLLFCIDGANPTYADANHFANCNNTPQSGQVLYYDYAPFTGTFPTDCNQVFSQVSDTDGGAITAMMFTSDPSKSWSSHPPFAADSLGWPSPGWGLPLPQLPATAENPNGLIDFPVASVEFDVRFRQDNLQPYGTNTDTTPDFFTGSTPVAINNNAYTGCSNAPPHCDGNYDTSGKYGGWEIDIDESYNGAYVDAAIHTWNVSGLTSGGSNQWSLMSGNLYNVPFFSGWQNYHNVSVLASTDGTSIQWCAYIDHSLVTTPWQGQGQVAGQCKTLNLGTSCSAGSNCGMQYLLKTRDVLEWWLGNTTVSTTTHYWIEYEAVWGPSNANAYRINSPIVNTVPINPPLQSDGAGNFVGWDTQIPACLSTFTSAQHPVAGCQLTQ